MIVPAVLVFIQYGRNFFLDSINRASACKQRAVPARNDIARSESKVDKYLGDLENQTENRAELI